MFCHPLVSRLSRTSTLNFQQIASCEVTKSVLPGPSWPVGALGYVWWLCHSRALHWRPSDFAIGPLAAMAMAADNAAEALERWKGWWWQGLMMLVTQVKFDPWHWPMATIDHWYHDVKTPSASCPWFLRCGSFSFAPLWHAFGWVRWMRHLAELVISIHFRHEFLEAFVSLKSPPSLSPQLGLSIELQ